MQSVSTPNTNKDMEAPGLDFVISTREDGRNSGRAYQMRCDSRAESVELVEFLKERVKIALQREE